MKHSRSKQFTLWKKRNLLLELIVICGLVMLYMFWNLPNPIEVESTQNNLRQRSSVMKELISILAQDGDDGILRRIPFISTSSILPLKNDVTLVTHGSTSRLNRVLVQSQIWKGPISLSVYITSLSDVDQLIQFLHSDESIKMRIDVHAVVQSSKNIQSDYPINIMRNVALESVRSDFVLPIDADFLTNVNAYETLQSLLSNDDFPLNLLLRSRSLLVLPAFERFDNKSNDTLNENDILLTKEKVLELKKVKTLVPFHEYFTPGHGPTNFQKWYSAQTPYLIEYGFRFEPYVVAYRHGLPRYWENFKGFGFNKASWLLHLHYENYKYYVIHNCFVWHLNHDGGGEGRMPNQKTIEEWMRFKLFLHYTFGAPKDELLDWTSYLPNAIF